jgi:hypothetical protein
MNTFDIRYCFRFPDGRQENYDLKLDAVTLDLLCERPELLPPWTSLDFHRCPNCPLPSQTHPHCPSAAGLVELVTGCSKLPSYDELHVDVITPERTVSKKTSAQRGLSSLMGLIMATSGCPHTSFFKPMARFHLPLASEEETIYRASSMYLLAQYFAHRQGLDADLELKGLKKIYENIQTINRAMSERLRAASKEDSSVNALIILDILAKTLPYAIKDSLEEIRYLFKPFLK